MLIAISGSQGVGKSSVLNSLKDLGYSVIERKTSRSILSDWGISLDTANSPEYIKQFQEEIISRKYQDEELELDRLMSSNSKNKIIFTERTFSDVFVYAIFAIGKNNEYSNWLNEYYQRCLENQRHYSHVFYISGGSFTIENDGVRGINPHYQQMVDVCMQEYTKKMTDIDKFNIISTTDHDQRVSTILNKI